ncbi:MAG: hypothetical protein J7621_03100 [Niastella sp.]|nr:hypothetical protein [Niastella sp.]
MKQGYFSFTIAVLILLLGGCKKDSADDPDNGGGNGPNPVVVPKDSTIITFAGNGTAGFSGDNGPAVNAQLSTTCRRVCVDNAGNVYIADGTNHRIRKIDKAGIITTIAGTGANGFAGDNGAATSAQLSAPEGLLADAAGNILFADKGNDRIRKISPSGVITTIAGTKYNYSPNYGDGGSATSDSVRLNAPNAIALDKAGNLFIADWASGRIRKVTASTGIITTIAGKRPSGLAGNGDGGPALNAKIPYPTGLAFDQAGNLFIVSEQTIRKIDLSGIITTIAGTGQGSGDPGNGGPAISANIWPVDITFNNFDELIIADYGRSLLRKIDKNGIIYTLAGGYNAPLGDGGKPINAGLTYPTGVACDGTGNIYIADYGARRVRKIQLK